MTELATAWVQIVPSAKGIQSQLEKELTPAATKAGEKSGQGFAAAFEKNTGKSLKDFGKSALIGAAALGAGLFGVTSAAGNLEAALAANKQVLGETSQAVQDWARNSVENVGLSERAALQAATAFGQLGKVAGLAGDDLAGFSIDMVTLAADLAAFADVPADQAVQDLRAAFAGSTETMQKYNVFLNETELKAALFRATGEKVTGVLTAQQRVLAVQAALMEQTGDIQGQAAREADGWQRALDNLKATLENTAAAIGEDVLPMVTTMVGGLTSAIGAVGDLNDVTGGLVGGLLLVGTTGLGAAGGLALAADKASRAVNGFKAMSSAMQVTSLAAGGVAAAAVAGFLIWDRWRKKQEEIRLRTDSVTSSLKSQITETFNLAAASADATGEIDGLAAAQLALNNALTDGEDDGAKIVVALGELGLQADQALDVLTRLSDDPLTALKELASQAGLTADEAAYLADVVNSTDDAWFASSESGGHFTDAMRRAGVAMEELQDQVEKVDLDKMASDFLNSAAAGSEQAGALVEQAKAAATSAEGTLDAVAAYEEYGRLLGELPADQRNLVLGLEETATAIDTTGEGFETAAEEAEGFNQVASSTIKVMSGAEKAFDRAADQANVFRGALDRLIGNQISFQDASDDMIASTQELEKIIRETAAGTEGYSTSLDENTEAGRENRELIRQHVQGILTFSGAMINSGHSIDEASAAALEQRGVLEDLLVQFGLTKDEAQDYIDTLGLTPESVETAIELQRVEGVKAEVEDLIDKYDEIPSSVATQVQVAIDQGAYDHALRLLQDLERRRSVRYTPTVRGAALPTADGGYFDSPQIRLFGEAGAEAVMPLTRPDRMKDLLADQRILGPTLAALPLVDAPNGRQVGPLVQVGEQHFHNELDVDTWARDISYSLAAAV